MRGAFRGGFLVASQMFSYVSHTFRYLSLWFQFAAEKVLFFLKSLEIGTDETIRMMPCVMMYQNKEPSRLEETTPRRIFKRSRVCMF